MGKVQRVLGILLMISGIVVCIWLIVFEWQHLYGLWSNNDPGKADMFATFREFYWSRAKGSTALAIGIGGVISAVGYLLYREVPSPKPPWLKP